MLVLTMILTMTAGTGVIMWLGENITDRGVGNGMSLLIFTSIIATFPGQLWQISTINGPFALGLVLVVGFAVIAGVVFVEQAQRRIPVQYAKRMVGRQDVRRHLDLHPAQGQHGRRHPGHLRLVAALRAAAHRAAVRAARGRWRSGSRRTSRAVTSRSTWSLYSLLIIFFTYFYVAITFNPDEVADNMKQYGGFIPGIRAGKPTAEYLDYVLTRITLPGSIYLAIIAIIPFIAFAFIGVQQRFIFGGTSLLIMVGVGLDTVKQIESQLQQRNYEGFLR